jgi:uncharacterized protein (DUF885 family)
MRILLVALAVIAGSCAPSLTEDQKFESLAGNYIGALLRMNPEWATTLGDHRYDNEVSDYSPAGVAASRALAAAYLDSVKSITLGGLNAVNRIDCRILRTNLEYTLFQIDSLREYEWNPMNYNPGGAIYVLLARDFAPLDERLESVRHRLIRIPAVLDAARKVLKTPPKIYTETALQQNTGTIGLIRDELNVYIAQSGWTAEKKEALKAAQDSAVGALRSFGEWMQKDLLPRSTADFRLGDELYRRKLQYALESDISKEEIMKRAESDLRATQEALYETALPLYRGFLPKGDTTDKNTVIRKVLDKLAGSHPGNENIVERATGDLQKATEFVRAQNLVTVPSDPVKVIVMPEFQRGVAVAYCDAAGPLEKNGQTLFSISPTPKDWTKERTVSFFREYNDYMLQNLTIHEAMPGHYLQLAHANQFKAPTMVRAIFSSGTFVEGWATYAEQLMAEKGYGGPEVRMQQLKMRLRLIINAMLDQKIHTQGMTEKEAMDLMKNEGYQEEGEAAGKWRRACLSSTQLSTYYVGNIGINDLRTAYEKKFGPSTGLKTMHDALLSFGSPAPRYLMDALGL